MGKGKPEVSPEVAMQIVTRYQARRNLAAVGKEFRVSRATVRELVIAAQGGGAMRRGAIPVASPVPLWVLRLHYEVGGLSLREIMAAFDLPWTSARRLLGEAGTMIRPPSSPKRQRGSSTMAGETPWPVAGHTFGFEPGTHVKVTLYGVVDDECRQVLLHGASGEKLQLAWLGGVGAMIVATMPPPSQPGAGSPQA